MVKVKRGTVVQVITTRGATLVGLVEVIYPDSFVIVRGTGGRTHVENASVKSVDRLHRGR